MAFHQPTLHSLQRVSAVSAAEHEAGRIETRPRREAQVDIDESQTWVLFSPATEATATSYLTESEQSLETPGRSRLSELGSREAPARSEWQSASRRSGIPSALDEAVLEDDAELDSLDSHLPEFRSLPAEQQQSSSTRRGSGHALPVFPGHDGLGSFRLDRPALDTDAQDHIYQFERFNPRRVRRRRESLERLPQVEPAPEHAQDSEKRQRIEAWRLEHSRVLLEEVQRETRRRRASQSSSTSRKVVDQTRSGFAATTSGINTMDEHTDDLAWHDEDASPRPADSQGLVARFTRKVMTDIFGIDDHVLSLLLGQETLSEIEDELSATPRASQMATPPASTGVKAAAGDKENAWELRVLARVSEELGLIVNQLSQHPGAFSTYTRVQHAPLPYAGLPVIPEANASTAAGARGKETRPVSLCTDDEFGPTMQQRRQPIPIPGRAEAGHSTEDVAGGDVKMSNAFTKEEWEQDLDIKLVFRYLRSRFSPHSSPSPPTGAAAHLATLSAQDAAAKAARVRQHHPLVSRARAPAERRPFKAKAAATSGASPAAMRHHSSCASQSTRRSARRSSGSSRHYWDIGGSLGTGSVIASHGPMGSWGEV